MNMVEVIDHYIERCLNGFPIDKVRGELKEKNYSDEDVWFIVREVDNYLLNNQESGNKTYLKVAQKVGMVLMVIGLLIWLGNYLGIIPIGSYSLLSYGLVFSGAALYYGIKWF